MIIRLLTRRGEQALKFYDAPVNGSELHGIGPTCSVPTSLLRYNNLRRYTMSEITTREKGSFIDRYVWWTITEPELVVDRRTRCPCHKGTVDEKTGYDANSATFLEVGTL
jgi:hypothetical protein